MKIIITDIYLKTILYFSYFSLWILITYNRNWLIDLPLLILTIFILYKFEIETNIILFIVFLLILLFPLLSFVDAERLGSSLGAKIFIAISLAIINEIISRKKMEKGIDIILFCKTKYNLLFRYRQKFIYIILYTLILSIFCFAILSKPYLTNPVINDLQYQQLNYIINFDSKVYSVFGISLVIPKNYNIVLVDKAYIITVEGSSLLGFLQTKNGMIADINEYKEKYTYTRKDLPTEFIQQDLIILNLPNEGFYINIEILYRAEEQGVYDKIRVLKESLFFSS